MFDLNIKIPVGGLKEGDHQFSFHINDEFFRQFEHAEIQKGKVEIHVLLKKTNRVIVVETRLKGVVETMCDRCLDMFDLGISYKDKSYVKTGNNVEDSTDEVLIMHESDSELDLTQYMYENIHLCLPYKREHGLNKDGSRTCNQEMLEKLKQHTREESNNTDPRWDKLKDII